jgi:threonine dehydratase
MMLDVLRARRRIAPYVYRTPLVRSAWLSGLAAADVVLKAESLQRSNSF